ncbi:hypothetical protein ACIQC9_06760 [Brevundimonas sp. NPDC092305]|uniref:hypothetical protein n=1 Tax=Brevundimonas sp. NPDC092305 TaxID=3363957 RepID=UPI0037F18D35
MSIAIALAVMVAQAPPAPTVTLLQLPAETLSVEGHAANRDVLSRLQPAYVRILPSRLETSELQSCWTQAAATEGCMSRVLERMGSAAGEIVVTSWEKDGHLHWLCVGEGVRPFSAKEQRVVLGPLGDLYRDGESSVLHRAAGCMTYAAHQSGW